MPKFNFNGDGAFGSSEFRASNGKRVLQGLFFEYAPVDKAFVKFTLKDADHLGYPSLLRLYLEAHDPTEYTFATKYFESFDHWRLLCKAQWFQPHLEKLRYELEMKMKAEAVSRIIGESRDPKSPSRFTANKWIVEKGWEPKEEQNAKRGRPTKDEIKAAAYDLATEATRLDEDLERLSGKVN